MESRVKYMIIVNLENNQEIKFTRCGHVIYYFDTTNAIPVETPKDKITNNETIDNLKFLLLATHCFHCYHQYKIFHPTLN